MKKSIKVLLLAMLMPFLSNHLYAQDGGLKREFGLSVGGFTNFPCNESFWDDHTSAITLAPSVRVGKHEFYGGMLYPLNQGGLATGDQLISKPGAIAGYKFYLFNINGRENLYLNYSFQYLRFKGSYTSSGTFNDLKVYENDTYINNVFSLGYVVFFDANQRFGFYYTLGYMISQASNKLGWESNHLDFWYSKYIWNNLSTNIGFGFKLKSFDKKMPKAN